MDIFQNFVAKRPLTEIIGLAALALAIHAIVLKFIFPGYYSPLYPHHSDFYISVAMANSPGDFFQYRYLGYSRPLGMLFLKIIGHFGVHGAILVTIINVAINCSLSAWFMRKVLALPFNNLFIFLFCVYCFLLFVQPDFYIFYTQDVFSHLSYFLLLIGTILYFKFHSQNNKLGNFSYFFFSICAFLCKETYALTALFGAFLWLLYYRKISLRKAVTPFLITGIALTAVLIFNVSIKSVFTGFRSVPVTDPYYVNATPKSVFKEMYQYAGEGLNAITWLMIAAILFISFLFYKDKRIKNYYWLTGCIVGAFLSWIPNALIPNHHHGGYSFNGAYLLYLPILSVPLIVRRNKFFFFFGIGIVVICLFSPFLNQKKYASLWWSLEQESNQRNLLHSLYPLLNGLNPSLKDQTILITGLSMPFYPFHHPLSLKVYPNAKNANFDIINYSITSEGKRDNLVKFIPASDVKIENYSAIWMFDSNGKILKNLVINPEIKDSIAKNNYQDLIIYPDSLKIEKLSTLLK